MKLHGTRWGVWIAALLAAAPLATPRAATADPPAAAYTRGRASGGWCAPTLTAPGRAVGHLYDAAGAPRFDLRLSMMQPMHGERALLFGEIVPIEGSVPRGVPHMYVSGFWEDVGDDKGRFTGLIVSDLGLTTDQGTLGWIRGDFDLTPVEPARTIDFSGRRRARREGMLSPAPPWYRRPGDGIDAVETFLGRARPWGPVVTQPCYKGPDLQRLRGTKAPAQPVPANELCRGIFTGTWALGR